jgi:hypothetical protein
MKSFFGNQAMLTLLPLSLKQNFIAATDCYSETRSVAESVPATFDIRIEALNDRFLQTYFTVTNQSCILFASKKLH